jgi:hypothetical protein
VERERAERNVGKFLLTRVVNILAYFENILFEQFYKIQFETEYMAVDYRKAIGGNVWHFCENCNTWPLQRYIASQTPEQIGDEVLCNECVARHQIGDCENYIERSYAALAKCPVIVGGRECGRTMFPELIAGLHMCSAGHRILVVPEAKSRK